MQTPRGPRAHTTDKPATRAVHRDWRVVSFARLTLEPCLGWFAYNLDVDGGGLDRDQLADAIRGHSWPTHIDWHGERIWLE